MVCAARVLAADIAVSLPQEPPGNITKAAEELADHLRQMTGREVSLAAGETEAAVRVLLRSDPSRKKELGPEGYHISSRPDLVLLTGATPLGLQHAVYAFLEGLGCRWFFPGDAWVVIPKLAEAQFPTFELTSRPDYQMRRIWYGWGIGPIPKNAVAYRDWCRRNRMGGSLTGSTGHAYAAFVRPDLHFEEHPEWFPLVDGNRIAGGQVCVSNPVVRERAIKRALDFFKARPDTVMISMSPNDGAGWCQCTECAKLGSVTDQALWLANQVADAIREPFPDKLVAMYAYAGTSVPPNIEASPNVIIFIATAFNYAGFGKSLEGWSKKARLLGIREYYNVIIWNRDMPRWQVDRMRRSIPGFHAKGAIALNAESGNEWAPEGLNYYIASRLLWDTEADVDALLDDFFKKCWGKAAVPMRRYYERFKGGGRMSSRTLAVCLHDLKEASELAESPEVVRRLDQMKLYLHWVRLFYEHNAARGAEAIAAARKAMHFAWRIRTTNMVHSYAQFRERRIWKISQRTPKQEIERWKLTDQPLDAPAQPDAELAVVDGGVPFGDDEELEPGGETDEDEEGIEEEMEETDGGVVKIVEEKAPVQYPPMYTHEETEALFQEDLAAVGQPLDVPSREYSDNLVPVPAETPGIESSLRAGSPRYRGTNRFRFHADSKGPSMLTVHPGFIRKGRASYAVHKVGQPEEAIAEGKVEGSEVVKISLEIPAAGQYRFRLSGGGMASRLDFGEKHGVWELRPGGGAHVISGSGRQYFYVPKGTSAFAVGMATPDGGGKMTIRGPKGEVRLQKAGNYAPGEEFAVKVPEDLDAAVWSFQISRCEDATGIYLLGVPPYASIRPGRLLVPAETLQD